ncbi:MAG TPA: AraC family transcriptional regulator [Cytophagales bacterium]|nr:AraC family transcriptional regulator [Cytophagales bacterium]HAA20930.1 AraC family transcriptional regulator [Cytophagales bacterium]HAP64298.1 AraC family transcriptional regulator [Cytophagales bacterium]
MLEQFTYFALFQTLFLIAIFTVSARKRRQVNRYLFVLVCLLLLGLVAKVGTLSLDWSRQLKGISEFAVLFFGPTLYLFVLSTLSPKRFALADLVHYLPGVLYSLVVTFYYILPPQEVILERIASGELYRVVRILVGVGLAVNLTYFGLSILKFRELKAQLQAEVSYALKVDFIQNFLIALGVCFAIWLAVYFISFGNNLELEINSRDYIWLAIALVVLFISYYQMVAPSVFQWTEATKEAKYAQSKFSNADLDRLKAELERIMEEKKPYLNSKLLKSELAEMMHINAPELSRLLNERIGMSFFEYVNYQRIHEFIRLAKSPLIEQKTLLGLAQEAGFHSKSTFNKSFKQIMGCPPSEYLNRV